MTPDWITDALCRTEGHPELWFPADTGNSRDARRAKEICRRCPVAVQCLTDAIRSGERHGVRAGVNFNNPHARRRAIYLQATARP